MVSHNLLYPRESLQSKQGHKQDWCLQSNTARKMAQLSAQCCRENLPVTSQTALHWTAARTSIQVLFNKALKTLFHLILFALPGHIIVTGYHTHSLKSLFFLQIQQFDHIHNNSKIISYIISSHAAALLSLFTSLSYSLFLHQASNCCCYVFVCFSHRGRTVCIVSSREFDRV